MSADPLLAALPGLDEAIGDNLNLYAYAGNNPVARVDLTGFEGMSLKEQATAGFGFVIGFMQGVAPGGMVTEPTIHQAQKGLEHAATFQQYKGAGQIVGGAVSVGTGVPMGGVGGGTSAGSGGTLALAAAPATALAAVRVGNGVVAMGVGAQNYNEGAAKNLATTGGGRSPSSSSARGAKQAETTKPETAAKKAETGGGKTGRKISKDARETGQSRLEEARKRFKEADSKANKTPADKKQLEKLRNEIKQAEKRLRASEEHARKNQGPSR